VELEEAEAAGETVPGRLIVPDPRLLERHLARVQAVFGERDFADLDEANAALDRAMEEGLLDGPSESRPPATPLEAAQELVYAALAAQGRLRVKRARQALAACPDCAEAWVLLAEEAPDASRARELYEKAVQAAARVLGLDVLATAGGAGWGRLAARPYLRARAGLARTLEATGDHQGAESHYREVLRLDRGDALGVRDSLLGLLFDRDAGDQIDELLRAYADDDSTVFAFGRALRLFGRDGDSAEAREALWLAVATNRFAARELLAPGEEDRPIQEFDEDDLVDAQFCREVLGDAWKRTPGATEWLRVHTRGGRGARVRPRRRAGGKRRRRR
jgi:tetratricopeptide (TPR) repeat protein